MNAVVSAVYGIEEYIAVIDQLFAPKSDVLSNIRRPDCGQTRSAYFAAAFVLRTHIIPSRVVDKGGNTGEGYILSTSISHSLQPGQLGGGEIRTGHVKE